MGRFGFAFLVLLLLLGALLMAAISRERRRARLYEAMTCASWLALLVVAAGISNHIADEEAKAVVVQARAYKAARGLWPSSLSQLPSYAPRVDGRGRLRVSMAKMFIANESVMFNEFPFNWASYSLVTGQRQSTDAW